MFKLHTEVSSGARGPAREDHPSGALSGERLMVVRYGCFIRGRRRRVGGVKSKLVVRGTALASPLTI
jgi:hypothetical protein